MSDCCLVIPPNYPPVPAPKKWAVMSGWQMEIDRCPCPGGSDLSGAPCVMELLPTPDRQGWQGTLEVQTFWDGSPETVNVQLEVTCGQFGYTGTITSGDCGTITDWPLTGICDISGQIQWFGECKCCGCTPGQAAGMDLDITGAEPPVGPNVCPTCPNGTGAPGTGTPETSDFPIRYATGEVMLSATDIIARGYGKPWGHSRRLGNRLSFSRDAGNGFNWFIDQWPYVERASSGSVAVMGGAGHPVFYDGGGGQPSYSQQFHGVQPLRVDHSAQLIHQPMMDGSESVFDAVTGVLVKSVTPGGQTTVVTKLTTKKTKIAELQQSATVDGVLTTDRYTYEYFQPFDQRLKSVTLARKVDSGDWVDLQRADYTYYELGDSLGDVGDLKTVITSVYQPNSESITGTTYYRYWKSAGSVTSSSSSSWALIPAPPYTPQHLIKYALNPAAYARMTADGYNPEMASDALLAQYADFYFEYDDERRVTKELVQGGSQTFLFDYETSDFPLGLNSWATKTVETRPDGNRNILYCNYAGQTMLHVLKTDSERWMTFSRYNSVGRCSLIAEPSAVTDYDEMLADLVGYNSGSNTFLYLRDHAGLIHGTEYDADNGYVTRETVRAGQLGSPTTLREFEYCRLGEECECAGSSSSSSSSSEGNLGGVWLPQREIVYPSTVDPSLTQITSYCYSFYPDTNALREKITTLPVVPDEQNGTGVAATRREYFDLYGQLTWSMDERGIITRMSYDVPTAAMTQRVDDVDTSLYDDVPAGWTTPAGGGQNLVTDYEHNDLGDITQSLGPAHTIDLDGDATEIRRATWTVYDYGNHITYSGQGYVVAGDFVLVNPVSITKMDASGRVNEQIQAIAPSTEGTLAEIIEAAGGGEAAFPQSSYTRWTTWQYTDCCLAASQRVYHLIPSSGEGTSGTNYDETDYGYDVLKRRNRTVTPGGTITFQVYDVRGQVIGTYIGTNDNGATNEDPTGGGAFGNNMKIVTANIYDGGLDGGDGYLTQQTQSVTASDVRVTTFCYDFRGRRRSIDGEIDFFQCDTYDNLNRIVRSERYDTFGTCCTNPSGSSSSSSSSSSGAVPGPLIARSETRYDARDRVYQTLSYAVNPTTGDVGNALIDNSWYDAAGNVLATVPAGASLFSKIEYDSLGRTIAQSTGYNPEADGAAPLGNGTPDSIDNDVVLEQSFSTYDEAGNVIESVQKQRYHNAADDELGELQDPSTTPKARVTYAAQYPDALGRPQASANYGTNGGTALSRPDTTPTRSNTILVTEQSYDDAGNLETTTDPASMVTRVEYDDAGRRVTLIENYQPGATTDSSSSSGSGCDPSDDVNRTTRFAYTADGEQATLTAVNSDTGNQVTTYTYGTTLDDSELATSVLLRSVAYPDSSGGSDIVAHTYNRQGQRMTTTDQRGCEHIYLYDKLGRLVHDCVKTLGTGVDDAVRRLSITYEVRGLPLLMTSYDDSAIGSGNVLNQVKQQYNDFGQSVESAQSHDGAVTP